MRQILHKSKRWEFWYGKYDFLRLVLVVVALLVVSTVNAASEFIVDGIHYTPNDDGTTCSVSGCDDSITDVIIPETVTDEDEVTYTVTSIGESAFNSRRIPLTIKMPNSITSIGKDAFHYCYGLAAIEMSSSLVNIGESAFSSCNKLTSIELPSTVANIGENAFSGCFNLTSINIPSSVTSIEDRTFFQCLSLASIEIPSAVTSIGKEAFRDCRALTSINIPNTVTLIEEGTFYGCDNLTSIEIPLSITSIGNSAFEACYNLVSIEIPNSVTTIGASAFMGCNRLTSVNIPTSVTIIEERTFAGCSCLPSIEIPNSVTWIGNRAFEGCRNLTIIEIPGSVTGIGEGAFSDCRSLASIKIPNSVMYIGDWVFQNCSCLESIEVPQSVTSIGMGSFSQCEKLSSIEIPNTVMDIKDVAFYGCYNLSSVKIPNSVIWIGNNAFQCCENLVSVEIPSSVTSIGREAFGSCKKLTSIEIPSSITRIEDGVFNSCFSLTSVKIPNTVTSIGANAFGGCEVLPSIEIPNSVTSIGDYAFASCKSLTSVVVPNSVTNIGKYAFADCNSLNMAEIPNSITNIGDYAFLNCSSLASLYSLAATPPAISSSVFENVDKSTCILYVPEGCDDDYVLANGWKEFKNIYVIGSIVEFDKKEWETLMAVREKLIASGWECPWNVSLGINGVGTFEGLKIAQGHVAGLDLSDSNLTGNFPWSVFDFTNLVELDLSGNNFSGDIGEGMLAAIAANPTATANLAKVDISNNKFCGNIALFANNCPALQSLDASGNCISDVIPAISPNVTTLNLNGQDLSGQIADKVVDLDLANIALEKLFAAVPTVLTYNHETQAYNKTVELLCTTGEISDIVLGEWDITSNNSDDCLVYISFSSDGLLNIYPNSYDTPNIYYGESGDILNAMFLDYSSWDCIKSHGALKMRLMFAAGDANFDGDVDITDLQTIILQILGQNGNELFNYTAANTVKDETLNVQDVVGEVNLLLAAVGTNAASASMAKTSASAAAGTTATDAAVYCRGGELKIYSSVPVAAFDVVVDNVSSLTVCDRLSALGMTCAVKETAGGTHIIGYSLNGGSIPAGETTVASLRDSGCRVSSAVLSDGQANKIPVALNAGTTAIGSVSDGQPGVELVDGRLVVNANGADGDVDWTVTALDGRLLGRGTVSGHSGGSVIDLDVRGVVIVTLKSADGMIVTKKVTVNKN